MSTRNTLLFGAAALLATAGPALADTLYTNAWLDLSRGPLLFDVPAFGARYYTLAFMDLYGKPHHVGTRTNGGAAARYALVGPAGGAVPQGLQPVVGAFPSVSGNRLRFTVRFVSPQSEREIFLDSDIAFDLARC